MKKQSKKAEQFSSTDPPPKHKGKAADKETQVIEQVVQNTGEHIVVPLAEEELQVVKQWVEAGTIVLRKRVQEETKTVPVELAYEEVQVDRVPVNKVLADGEAAAPRQEGDVWIIPVVEEELVVTKRRVVREELRVNKRRVLTRQEVSDVVRSEHVEVETAGNIERAGAESPRRR
ncbi:MAG: YsnF/AvaK domain-containing protein [Chloroflexi bacterium]|nr:YsnF/AvaK domain-containing protein [Chloroflexota bacterium]